MSARGGSIISATLFSTVEQTVGAMGYALVDLERGPAGLLRVTLDLAGATGNAEPNQGPSITLEDCERVSRQLSQLFLVDEVDYDRLEVSSPGLDRRLRTAGDFRRFNGAAVFVQLTALHEGRRKLRGHIVGTHGPLGDEWVELIPLAEVPEGGVIRAKAVQPAKKRSNAKSSQDPAALGQHASKTAAAVAAALPAVHIALALIEKARLIPVIDFRGAERRAIKSAQSAEASVGGVRGVAETHQMLADEDTDQLSGALSGIERLDPSPRRKRVLAGQTKKTAKAGAVSSESGFSGAAERIRGAQRES